MAGSGDIERSVGTLGDGGPCLIAEGAVCMSGKKLMLHVHFLLAVNSSFIINPAKVLLRLLFNKPAHGMAGKGPPRFQGVGGIIQSCHMSVATDDRPAKVPVMAFVAHRNRGLNSDERPCFCYHVSGFAVVIMRAGLNKKCMFRLILLAPETVADPANGDLSFTACVVVCQQNIFGAMKLE